MRGYHFGINLVSFWYLQTTEIACSHVCDPFPGIFAWLEKIAAGELPAEYWIDEEGKAKLLSALPVDEERIVFQISPWHYGVKEDPTLFLKARVLRKQLISEFVVAWEDFIQRKYDPQEWEHGFDLTKIDTGRLRDWLAK